MRISKDEKTRKLQCLIEAFQNTDYLSFLDIRTILNCGKTSAIDYLNTLRDFCVLETKKINGFKYYHAIFNDDLYKYKKLTKQDAILFDTLQTLQYFCKNYEGCEQLYNLSNNNQDNYIPLVHYSKSTFDRNIESLIDKGIIIKDSNTNKILIMEDDNYRISMNYSDLKNFARELNALNPTDRYYRQLNSIKNKINPFVDDIDDPIFNQNYFSYGKEINLFSDAAKRFKKYDHIDFSAYAVEITYQDKFNTMITCVLFTGFIVYVEEKDIIYLVGKDPNNHDYYPIIIADSIINIKQTDIKNHCFFNQEFSDIYHQMFSISTAKPYEVEVIFNNVSPNLNIIKRLSQKRKKTSSVLCINNQIHYRDTIRGLYDFANFLRRFGNTCTVIKPIELIQIMNDSVHKTLKEYELLKEDTYNE